MSVLDLFSGSSPVLGQGASLGYSNSAPTSAYSDLSGGITGGTISGNNQARGFTVPTIFYVGITLWCAAMLVRAWKK